MYKGIDYRTMSVEFSNVHFHEEAEIKADDPFKLGIMIHKGNYYFEVCKVLKYVITLNLVSFNK